MKTSLSKSRYTKYCQCAKALWLSMNKPEEATVDAGVEARFAEGNVVGDLAMRPIQNHCLSETECVLWTVNSIVMFIKEILSVEQKEQIFSEEEFIKESLREKNIRR